MDKLYYTIAEIARMLQVTTSMLRYWEKEFNLNPHRTEKGSRRYNEKDIETLRLIHHLVKVKGLTLAGAKQKLKENKESVVNNAEIVRRLKGVRTELVALVEEFEEMEKLV
ncbi:transcriptional regulator [Bacteroidia bacterium]|nr:transcriptional regulator [Bacteroidia bacterium]